MFDLPSKRERVAALETESAAPDFWVDNERARATLAEIKQNQSWVGEYDALRVEIDEAGEMLSLLEGEEDPSLWEEFGALEGAVADRLSRLELRGMLSDP
ncbi:MAG: PCRF domain-containing protein, partial [Gemmatimonadetes bacterium]|nr:PCRF domain-containing protein [Gemmatimonadota bacterium]